MNLTPQQLTLIDTHAPEPDTTTYGSEYLFDRAHFTMRRKGYSASMVVYQPDGKVKVRWRKQATTQSEGRAT